MLENNACKKKNAKSARYFYFLEKNQNRKYTLLGKVVEAETVGEEQSVDYLTFHDMHTHAILGRMTDLKYLGELNANAVYIDNSKFERIGENVGRTYFQPMMIREPIKSS